MESFWSWFASNEKHLFSMKGSDDPIFAELADKIREISPYIAFEIDESTAKDGKKILSISADRNIEFFGLVEYFARIAPELEHWDIVPFRQRVPMDVLINLEIEGQEADDGVPVGEPVCVACKDMKFIIEPGDYGVKITLYIKDYDGRELQEGMAMHLMEQAVGEYDLVKKVESIEFESQDRTPKHAMNFENVSTLLDEFVPEN